MCRITYGHKKPKSARRTADIRKPGNSAKFKPGLMLKSEEIMTLPKRTNKLIKSDIKKYGLSSIAKAKGAIEDSILCGIALIELKENTPHGQWEIEFKSAIDGVFGLRHGQKLMQIAAKKELLKIASESDILTLNDAIDLISNATPEQLEKAEQLKIEQEQKRLAEEQAKTEKPATKKAPEIIEGEFTEVKPEPKKPEPKPQEVKPGMVQIEAEKLEEMEDGLHELASLNNTISKDNASMVKVFDANDQMAAAVKEIKRLNDLNTSLEGRLNGFMTERNALIKEAKYWRTKFEKLEKANVQ
jgi:hypothetical protein